MKDYRVLTDELQQAAIKYCECEHYAASVEGLDNGWAAQQDKLSAHELELAALRLGAEGLRLLSTIKFLDAGLRAKEIAGALDSFMDLVRVAEDRVKWLRGT